MDRKELRLPPARLPAWVDGFTTRHGQVQLVANGGALEGVAADGSTFHLRLPFGRVFSGSPTVEAFLQCSSAPQDWGVVLVRKGGFAVARLESETLVASKVGQRHVQGRSKAGGQSQQRFARRRDNQAQAAYDAAREHAERLIPKHLPIVVGGDREAVRSVVGEGHWEVVDDWLVVPDPRRAVLESAIVSALSAKMIVVNA